MSPEQVLRQREGYLAEPLPAGDGHSCDRDHDHREHDNASHDHGHSHKNSASYSKFTGLLLPCTSRWPSLHAVMSEKDSRRLFYFMVINFAFMGVQAFYGYVTDSLGLLSDSIHMFFDCVALAVGLFAIVVSKLPPSEKFPYGFSKIETLSGFTNGVLLLLISIEIMFEGFERLTEGRETKRLLELFVVSTLGLVVNLVGIFAFGSHSHHGPGDSHKHSHGHSHDNDNMHGIYLHILADTLGSASVIISTSLAYFIPWAAWDPLASFLIAYLIATTAIPLVKSSAHRLLLTNPDDPESNLRNALAGVNDILGVASYTIPKFCTDESMDDETGGKLVEVVHITALRGSDIEEVRERVTKYVIEKALKTRIQIGREGDLSC